VFSANGAVFFVDAKGHLHRRAFDGTTLGPARDLNLTTGMNTPSWTPLTNVTGAAWDNGWLYYTLAGQKSLYRRGFSIESFVLESTPHVVSGPTVDGMDWSETRGLAIAGRYVYSGAANGNLIRRAFAAGRPSRAGVAISGPRVDGRNWSATTGMFAR
jgi:hypothetical protein